MPKSDSSIHDHMETSPSPNEIRKLRGDLSRAEFGARIGVTGLTVYRWELPAEATEARRPRGKVLARLRAFISSEARGSRAEMSNSQPPAFDLDPPERAALDAALASMNDGELERCERELVTLLASGALRSEAGRALTSVLLARLQLLVRHDTKSAFATLLAVDPDLARLPERVRLEYHLSAAYLYAHADAQIYNPGKTNHHAAMAEPLLAHGTSDHRFFQWYATFTAAVTSYDIALVGRAIEQFGAVRELATTPLHRCLVAEADAVGSLSLASTAEATRRLDRFHELAWAHPMPLQQLRTLIWRAEVAVEEAVPPADILGRLDVAEQLIQRHRIAAGIHLMLMRRNRGETLIRLGRRREAEVVLRDDLRVAREIAYTPIRISTTLARMYMQENRVAEIDALVAEALTAQDVQKDLTRATGRLLRVLRELQTGDAAADWCDRALEHLGELQRLGVWPIAYRHLALLAFAVASTKGAVQEAERLQHNAERAIEWSASPTASSVFRRLRATVLMRRGRLAEARQLVEAAVAMVAASGDLSEAALARRALANIATLDGSSDAAEKLKEADAELARLELTPGELVAVEWTDEREAAPTQNAPVASDRLVVALQRLATRGVGASMLHRELVSIVGDLFSGRFVQLEDVASAGGAITLVTREGDGAAEPSWFELSDGMGGRLRLGIGGAVGTGPRAAVEIVTTAAAMALEIANLRGLPGPPSAAAPLAPPPPEPPALANFIAESPSTRRLKGELVRLSGSRSTIVITGESGTGKEVVARAVHDLSRRAGRAYVTFNSATVPRELFDGQLFGYRKGAFTGATSDHPGVIRSADGGTLFLDEIGELPLDVQPKLLRFLENGEVLSLGDRKPTQVDVRVIAATHRDLLQQVRDGKFREDLYYRLQVIPVSIAPLRDRREDLLALARHFIRKMTPPGLAVPILTSDGESRLAAHRWPGNVRELRNVIERCMAFDPPPSTIGAAQLRL